MERRQKIVRIEPRIIAGKPPPNQLDAEAAVLSSCMLQQSTIDEVLDLLRYEMFYSDANGRIFEAITDLHGQRQGVDVVSVASWLRDRERLGQVGGAAYIAQLADATPAIAHVMTHARIVFDQWRARQLMARCQLTVAEGYSGVASVQGLLDEHSGAVHDIATKGSGSPLVALGEGLIEQLRHDWNIVQQGGGLMGIRTGYDAIDHKLAGLHDGDLYIVAARPGMGKTGLALGMAINIAAPPEATESLFRPPVEYGVPFFSVEMPREQLVLRATCTESRVDLGKYRQGVLGGEDWERLFKAASFLVSLPIWIDDTPAITVPQIRAKVRQMQSRWCRDGSSVSDGHTIAERRLGAVVVDYLQLMKGTKEGVNREQEISEISRGLKQLAKDLRVPVIALSQLNRSVETRGANKRPQLSDLRESGAIEQDADAILFVYREEYYNPGNDSARGVAEVNVAKQRNGPTGRVLLRFTGSCTRFDNLDHETASAYSAGDRDD